MSLLLALALALAAAPSLARKPAKPKPGPAPARAASPTDGITDLSHAVPMKSLLQQPSTADQYRALKGQIDQQKPAVADAKSRSDALAAQAEALQKRLVATAARVEALEREKLSLDAEVARLSAENERLSASFARDRVQVSRLLAVIERLQHDVPPAMAVRPDDSLAAARGAMLIGASLPGVYREAAALAQRLDALRRTRAALTLRREEAARNAESLGQARIELDQLLAMKQMEADVAATRYGDLKRKLDTIASQAVNLQALLAKVAELRSASASQGVVTVVAGGSGQQKLGRGSLLCPVVGEVVAGGIEGVGGGSAPGITYLTQANARVVSPADGKILFAGQDRTGIRVLILEIADGYDVVLAGLGHLDVRNNDRVLAGEPVGSMTPKSDTGPRLYFELRQKNGRGMSPAPYIAVALRKAKGT